MNTLKYSQAVKLWQEGLLKKIIWTNLWEVETPFVWYIEYETKSFPVKVPKWFISNLWSIPKVLWVFFNPTKYVAFLLHDWMYAIKWAEYSRKQADMILLEALHYEWASFVERFFIYFWVRLFWFLFYKK